MKSVLLTLLFCSLCSSAWGATFSDDFHRLGPAPGANWAPVLGTFTVSSNAVAATATGSNSALAYVTGLRGYAQFAQAPVTPRDPNPKATVTAAGPNATIYFGAGTYGGRDLHGRSGGAQ